MDLMKSVNVENWAALGFAVYPTLGSNENCVLKNTVKWTFY